MAFRLSSLGRLADSDAATRAVEAHGNDCPAPATGAGFCAGNSEESGSIEGSGACAGVLPRAPGTAPAATGTAPPITGTVPAAAGMTVATDGTTAKTHSE